MADGRTFAITSPNKVMFPERGETKLDLARYYLDVGEAIMRTLRDRPVLLERYPNGVGAQSFFQKRIPDTAPDWLATTTVQTINGTPSRALVIADLAHVLWAVNQGVLGLHVWPYRASTPQRCRRAAHRPRSRRRACRSRGYVRPPATCSPISPSSAS